MVKLDKFVLHTKKYNEFINITEKVEEMAGRCGITNGVVYIITAHTTAGITVNEALECLQSDMSGLMDRLVPEDAPYAHARMLHSYGTTAGNPTGHLKSMLTGNHAVFLLNNKKLVRGGAQDIFFCEYDGAQSRTVYMAVIGE